MKNSPTLRVDHPWLNGERIEQFSPKISKGELWIKPGKREINPEKGRSNPEKGRLTPLNYLIKKEKFSINK